MSAYTRVTEADQVTGEILAAAEETETWFGDDRIDWEDFWDRLDGYYLRDGTQLDLGGSLNSGAMRKIRRHILNLRRQG
jgi:hypothetical protein